MNIELTYSQKMEIVLGMISDSEYKKEFVKFLETQPTNFFESSVFTMQLLKELRK